MEENLLKVLPTCSRPNFGLKIELDPQYGRAYVLDVDAKSSAAKKNRLSKPHDDQFVSPIQLNTR